MENELKEAPLGYWEQDSYMSIIPENGNLVLDDRLFERVAKIEGVELKAKINLTDKEPGTIIVNYLDEDYEIGFYPVNFELPEMYIRGPYYFSNEEIEKLKNAKVGLTIFMKFGKDVRKSYQLQLKIACSIVPNLIGLMDESAEKMVPYKLVKMLAESKVEPAPSELYTVQAIRGENNEVWLHTHGLCRCGLTELEILKSDVDNYNNHYNLISTFATYLIDKNGEFDPIQDSAYIGLLSNNQPVVVTCKSWTKAFDEYEDLDLGGLEDRKDAHNSRTSVIFLYKNEEDEKNKVLSKVSLFDDKWGDNPIFFISNSETNRMKALAREKFDVVKEQFENKENQILIKVGLPVNPEEGEFEHIWFELLEFNGDRFKAKLTQEPYNVPTMHTGDIGEYTVNDVTDWIIYTPKFTVKPGTCYLIME